MLSRNYPRIGVVDFGRRLIESADLDPIYVGLQQVSLPQRQLARWLTAYWLFYSAGFASYASEQKGEAFWRTLLDAAHNTKPTPFYERWPRGSERRHFRGAVAVEAVTRLKRRFADAPEGFLEALKDGPADMASVQKRVQEYYLFGGWIAFKVADMLDAVCDYPVDQSDLECFLYDTPRKSIIDNWQSGAIPLKAKTTEDALIEAFHWLQKQLAGVKVPHKPLLKEPDWFALETVWCKHKSHMNGHYPLGKDILEISAGTLPWMRCSETAKRFHAALPRA